MPRGIRQTVTDSPEESQAGDESVVRSFVSAPMAVGVAVVAILGLACPIPPRQSLSAQALLLFAGCLLIGAIATSGLAALATLSVIPGRSRYTSGSIVQATGLAAIWVPAWTIALQTPSVITVLAGCFFMASASIYLKRYDWNAMNTNGEDRRDLLAYPFTFNSKGLFRVLLPSLGFALLVEAAGAVAMLKEYGFASILAGSCVALAIWRAGSKNDEMKQRRAGTSNPRAAFALVLAFVFTLVVLLPYLRSMRLSMGLEPLLKSRVDGANDVDKPRNSLANDSEGYSGIILLSPSDQHKKIIAPVKKEVAIIPSRLMQPMEIPFDGAYWYFKAPDKRPRPTARVVRGSSTKATIRSSDRYPLLMEAHQKLDEPIDLGCCSRIDIGVQNADRREGVIALELWVKKIGPPASADHYLGTAVIPSSGRPVALRSDAAGVLAEERLEFPVPSSMEGIKFDEITVVVRSAPERSQTGAQIAIRKFVLQP